MTSGTLQREDVYLLIRQNMKNYAKLFDDFSTNEFLKGAQVAKKVNLTSGQLRQSSQKSQDVSKMFSFL